jgi:predicted PurR-regulated permease PerM
VPDQDADRVSWVAYLLGRWSPGYKACSLRRSCSRAGAIVLVYLIGTLLVGGVGYALEPALAGQTERLKAAAPDMLTRVTDRRFLAQHRTLIVDLVERTARTVRAAAEDAGWLLTVPFITVCFLKNRPAFLEGTIDFLARRRDRASVRRMVEPAAIPPAVSRPGRRTRPPGMSSTP